MSRRALQQRPRTEGGTAEGAAGDRFRDAIAELVRQGYSQVWGYPYHARPPVDGRLWVGRHAATGRVVRLDRADYVPEDYRVPRHTATGWPGYRAAKKRLRELGFQLLVEDGAGRCRMCHPFTGVVAGLDVGDYEPGPPAPAGWRAHREDLREAGLVLLCSAVPAALLGLATRVLEGAIAWPAVSLGLSFGFIYGTWAARWFRRPGT